MKQLVNSWLEAEMKAYGCTTVQQALDDLNKECGLTVGHSRLAEWRRGKYTPAPKVIAFMLYRTVPWALVKVGLKPTEAQLDELEDLVLNMKVVAGDRHLDLS